MKIRLCDEKNSWNRGVLELGGSLYQSWQWGELRSLEGWKPWRILAEDGEEVLGAVQILERRLPILGVCVMYAPRGPLWRKSNPAVLPQLTDWLKGFSLKRRAACLRADPEILDADESTKEQLKAVGFRHLHEDQWSIWNLPRAIMIVDLRPSIEELMQRMHRKRREHVRQAMRGKLEFECGSSPEHLRDLYNLLNLTGERRGFAVRGMEHFLQIGRILFQDQQGQVILARHQGKIVAGLGLAIFGKNCYALNSGSDWQFRNLRGSEAVEWKGIEWAKGSGCFEFNMVGASTNYPPQEGNYGYGLYRFKKEFGADLHFYIGYFDLVTNSFSYKLFTHVVRKYGGKAWKAFAGFMPLLRRIKDSK